jgi:hypothetical protein
MFRAFCVGAIALLCASSPASAQYAASGAATAGTAGHRIEFIPMGGYAWTLSMDVYSGLTSGELDIKDAGYYGAILDINLARPGYKTGQLRLLYRREDSDLTYRSGLTSQSTDVTVEYWQIGGVGGIQRGQAMPFTQVTLGGTRFSGGGQDEWKFSMIFGLGVKYYASPKVGIMLQGNWPITFTDSYGGVSVGTGGLGVGITGTGVSQLDLGGGLIICF